MLIEVSKFKKKKKELILKRLLYNVIYVYITYNYCNVECHR